VGIGTKNAGLGIFPSEHVAATQETLTARASFSGGQHGVGAWTHPVQTYKAHGIWPHLTRTLVVQGCTDDQNRRFLGGNSPLVFRETVG
jgi:hypothetical protein